MTDLVFKYAKDTDFKEGQEYIYEVRGGEKRFVKMVRGELVLVDNSGVMRNFNLKTSPCSKYALIKDVGPTLFGQLSDEEKGALLLAHHQGKTIEWWLTQTKVWSTNSSPEWSPLRTYRVKPEPVVQTVVRYLGATLTGTNSRKTKPTTHKLSYNIVGGEIDCSSVKLEEL